MNVRIQKNGCPVVSDFNTPSRIIVKWLSQCDALIKLTPFRFVVKVLPRFSAECYSLICQTVSVARNRYDYELGMVRIEIPASKIPFSCCLSFTSRFIHGLMIASGMSRFCLTPACKIIENLIK